MIISEVLDAIDNINSITLESEITTCESLLNSYDKMLIIEENYNGNDINDFKIFQEGFGDDVKKEMKESGKNMSTIGKILSALPRFIIAIVKTIKNRLNKKTKNTAEEITENCKNLDDNKKEALSQLFPKEKKGKIDAKKILIGALGAGGIIASYKLEIPKKVIENSKLVLGKLKNKSKSDSSKQHDDIKNKNKSKSDLSKQHVEIKNKNTYTADQVFDRVNNIITVSRDAFDNLFPEAKKAAESNNVPELNDRIEKSIKEICDNNSGLLTKKEFVDLLEKVEKNVDNFETCSTADKVDIIAGMMFVIISIPFVSVMKKVTLITKSLEQLQQKIEELNQNFKDKNASNHDTFRISFSKGKHTFVITCDLEPCFYTMLANASNTDNTSALIKSVTKGDKYIEEVLNIKQETPTDFVKNVNDFIDNLYNKDSIYSAINKIKDQIDKEKDEEPKKRHTEYVTTAKKNLSNFSKDLSLIDGILDSLNIFTKEINKKFTDNSLPEIEYQENRTKINTIETSGFETSETN